MSVFKELSAYGDKQEILAEIIVQLHKDTGFDYSQASTNAEDPIFLETFRKDLAFYIQKVAQANHVQFMHIIYRVDISQSKMKAIPQDDFYFHHLSEMILSRIFQKTITKRHFKSK